MGKNTILDHEGEKVTVGGEDYIVVQKQSKATDWRLVILTLNLITIIRAVSLYSVQLLSYLVSLVVYCFSSSPLYY